MRRRLFQAAAAGVLVALVAWLALGWFAAVHACGPLRRGRWLGWLCDDGGAEGFATALVTLGWGSALPVMLGLAAFVAVALTGRAR